MQFINTLPNGKILDLSEFKAYADGKIDVTQNFEFCFRKGKKCFGKGENACSKNVFKRPQSFSRVVKSWD